MWVPRTPKRADFCGCPPCPLCFCWAGGESVTDGMDKFISDMLGGQRPTAAERKVLEDSAERIHVGNLARPERIEREFREADQERGDAMQMGHFLKEQRRAAERPEPPKVDLRPTLDELPAEAFEKKKPVEYSFTQWVTIDEISRVFGGSKTISPFNWADLDKAEEEKKPKKGDRPKWDGGDVKRRADKEAQRQMAALLKR